MARFQQRVEDGQLRRHDELIGVALGVRVLLPRQQRISG